MQKTSRPFGYFITFIIGVAIAMIGIGIFKPQPEYVHYHANYAIFIDGQRLDLSSDDYMEDLVKCAAAYQIQFAEDRAHMHENNHDVIHVHDRAVTWGHFMANLGFNFGNNYLVNDKNKIFDGNREKSIKLVLNRKSPPDLFNQVIRTEDRLLISFGIESREEVLDNQFPQVANNAREFNEKDDPGCGAE